jgi:2,3,4,5-tetrahydropyridine-2-carboxylate N-succinyltransferase
MGDLDTLRKIIDDAYDHDGYDTPEAREAVDAALDLLDCGEVRIAERAGTDDDGASRWDVNQWLKRAVLLSFRQRSMETIEVGPYEYRDKVPLKRGYEEAGVRVVPPAVVRHGAYVEAGAVLMPSYVNIGAWVGSGTMVDTWATVGSCAQIGRHCHLSGGAGIGGVLEPLQATPTIIEDHCFIGARSEVVEGVVVGHHSVIGMGVFLGQSTRIYNRATGEIGYGHIPPYSVVVSGQLPAADGSHSLYCAVIVKQVDEKTRSKTSVNDLLRGAVE